MNGTLHIQQAFQAARQAGRAALMPYFTLGYPTPEESLAVIEALSRAGADLIELGVPFSDPLADGPTIQRSSYVALKQGMTVWGCLEMVHTLRQRGINQPLLLMSYINPILSYGVKNFVTAVVQSGADGLIIPDLPVDEGLEIEAACRQAHLALTYLVAPTSTPERIQLLSRHSTGFLYLVSLTGVTGARQAIPSDLSGFIAQVRQYTELPLAVGFGISTPQQAAMLGQLVDGVIIGSALIEAANQAHRPAESAARFLRQILQGMLATNDQTSGSPEL